MLITKKFTVFEVLDAYRSYCVLDEKSISEKVVVWEVQNTVSF